MSINSKLNIEFFIYLFLLLLFHWSQNLLSDYWNCQGILSSSFLGQLVIIIFLNKQMTEIKEIYLIKARQFITFLDLLNSIKNLLKFYKNVFRIQISILGHKLFSCLFWSKRLISFFYCQNTQQLEFIQQSILNRSM